jgi:2'-5' RNA ligase
MARDRASRPGAKPIRLFVAIDVPPAARDAVAASIEPWRAELPRIRWAPPENWHVTVKFLGWTYPRLVGWVHDRVREAAEGVPAFRTRLTGLGRFPPSGRARVLWAGLDDERGEMAEVANAMDAALAGEFEPETRAFQPHLTVARSNPPAALPAGFADTPVEPVGFVVDHVTLYRSHLQRPAPRYEPLEVVQLRAGLPPAR